MWFQHNDCHAHSAKEARQALQTVFLNRWIGRSEQFPCSPRSPYHTPIDFSLWGTLKDKVYFNPPMTQENMKQRIPQACDDTVTSETIENGVSTLRNRLHHCIEIEGRQFEHL
ncbi:hypothetical protein WN55_05777 [Dufourea novaeangliae]|uniref:Histone-lysine N-methyltransferase SETMAR n=1 Tax=Dufourea novaeangliae TaxID=178035 RepID=A0A154PMR3_DUFNO|nr:hypothetical protein WN55_05777 [Dufourea novaeangliae]